VKEVAAMLKAIHAQEDRAAARQKAEQVAAKLKEMKPADAAAIASPQRVCATWPARSGERGAKRIELNALD